MSRGILWLTAACLLGSAPSSAGVMNSIKSTILGKDLKQQQTIKVLIDHSVDGAMLQVKGSYNIYDPKDGSRVGTRFLPKNMFIQPLPSGLRWGEEFPGIYQVAIVPDNEKTPILINGKQYQGRVYVYQINNKISIVNEVSLDDYVRSTLSDHVDPSIGKETLAALVIAARTDAFYKSQIGPSDYYNVDAHETGYKGEGVTGINRKLEETVAETKHLIMQYGVGENHNAFATSWTKNSAGKTVPYDVMFQKESGVPARSIDAPYAAVDAHQSKWSFAIGLDELAKVSELKQVTNFELYVEKNSQKVYKIRIYDKGQFRDFDFLAFQEKVGKERLRGSQFRMKIDGAQVKIEGEGEGHGAGLCLYSAEKMEEKGDNAAHILSKFFPGSMIQMIPEQKEVKSHIKQKPASNIAEQPKKTVNKSREFSS